jgi:hypothetical protein
MNNNIKYDQYRSNLFFYYYATFLRLRQECHIQSLLEQSFNLDQFLSKSDASWPVSDQFKVLTSLGGGPVMRVLSKIIQKGGSPVLSASISISTNTSTGY